MLRAVSSPSVRTLAVQNTDSSVTDATTNETTLFSCTVPGGALGPNDWLEIEAPTGVSGVAVARTLRVKFGGTTFVTYTSSAAGVTRFPAQARIVNRNSTAAQRSYAPQNSVQQGGLSALTLPTIATGVVDTTQDQTLVVTGQWGTAGTGTNAITLEMVNVRIVRAP